MNKGYKEPTGNHRYLARDGLYYNGYMDSPDFAEAHDAIMKPYIDEICKKLEEEIILDMIKAGIPHEEVRSFIEKLPTVKARNKDNV